MTILDLIKAACKTKGVPEKYAERIQKTFKIEKAEGMEAFVDLFKENILPVIQEAENEAKTTAETAAVAAYEAKHGLKDGKPVEDPDKNKKTEEELLKDLSPEVKAYLESMKKSVDDMAKKVGDSITNSANEAKKETVRMPVFRTAGWDVWIWLLKRLSRIRSRHYPKNIPESSKRRSMMLWLVAITLPVP